MKEDFPDPSNDSGMPELPSPTPISISSNLKIQETILYQQGPSYVCSFDPILFCHQAIVRESLTDYIGLNVFAYIPNFLMALASLSEYQRNLQILILRAVCVTGCALYI